jgi:hypothetical protein
VDETLLVFVRHDERDAGRLENVAIEIAGHREPRPEQTGGADATLLRDVARLFDDADERRTSLKTMCGVFAAKSAISAPPRARRRTSSAGTFRR